MDKQQNMHNRRIWQTPSLHHMQELSERKVTWLELFYDLVFVVIIAKLGHLLVESFSPTHLLQFSVLFLAIYIVWNGSTYYNERFETRGLENRLFFFLKIVAVSLMAIFVHDAFGDQANGFTCSYVFARLITTVLWLRAAVHVPAFRAAGIRIVTGNSISISLFIISVFIGNETKFVLWVLALTIDLLTPWFSAKHQSGLPKFSVSKMPERYGLFVIIVLGETIVAAVNGIGHLHHFDFPFVMLLVLSLSISFSVWWLYYDFVARRSAKPTFAMQMLWNYLHLLLMAAIIALGAAIHHVLSHGNAYELQLLLGSSMFIILLAIGCLEWVLDRALHEPTHLIWSPVMKFVSGISCFLIAIVPVQWPAILMLSIFLVIFGLNMTYGVLVWYRRAT